MGKDRFNRFKKNIYDIQNKTIYTRLDRYVIPNRKYLSDKQRMFLVNTVTQCVYEGDKKFLRSILVEGKKPTEKQKKVIKDILKNNQRKTLYKK